MVREYKGAYSGEHGDGLVRSEWVAWQFGPRLDARVRGDQGAVRPGRPDESRQDRARRRGWTTRRCSASRPATGTVPVATGARLVGVERRARSGDAATMSAPGTGGDPRAGFAKAVEMCNNNGHCRKFDAGTMCPSYRVTRDEQHLDARPREHAAPRAVGAARRRGPRVARAVREALDLCVPLQGLPPRMPDRRRHGEDEDRVRWHQWQRAHGLALRDRLDRVPAALGAVGVARRRGSPTCATRIPGARGSAERCARASAAQRSLPRWRRDTFLASPRPQRRAATQRPRGRAVRRHVQQLLRAGERARGARGAATPRAIASRSPARRPATQRPLCCGRTFLAAGLVDEAKREARRMRRRRWRRTSRRGAAIVGLEPSCLLSLRDEFLAMGLGEDARRSPRRAMLFEEFLVRGARAGRLRCRLRRCRRSARCCTAIATRRRSTRSTPTRRCCGWIPGLAVDVDRVELLRHGRQLRLRGRALRGVDADGRAVAAAGGARGRRRTR